MLTTAAEEVELLRALRGGPLPIDVLIPTLVDVRPAISRTVSRLLEKGYVRCACPEFAVGHYRQQFSLTQSGERALEQEAR